jgi:hypothetical protein
MIDACAAATRAGRCCALSEVVIRERSCETRMLDPASIEHPPADLGSDYEADEEVQDEQTSLRSGLHPFA